MPHEAEQMAVDLPNRCRGDFPILNREVHGTDLIFLDSAASSQKPVQVIEKIDQYYRQTHSNVHRGIHTLSEEASAEFEESRRKVATFLNAREPEEIIFTRGTTESLNLVVTALAANSLKAGDRVVLTEMEHHANLVPWVVLSQKIGFEIEYIPVSPDGRLILDELEKIITPNTKIVSFTHMSNVLGTINPVELITKTAHDQGALVVLDGAQGAPHLSVDVQEMDVDFYALSAHKMLGPTGIGALYGKREILERMEPYQYGGEMIAEVRFDRVTFNEIPFKFEAGTPNIAGAIGFGVALDYLSRLGMEKVHQHEQEITAYALNVLNEIPEVEIFGPLTAENRGAAISFVLQGVHPHDISTFLDTMGIAVRAGHHCAQPLHDKFNIPATTRASFYIYNTLSEVDFLAKALKECVRYF